MYFLPVFIYCRSCGI